jgi:tripartite ATP-independent transporter DctM subunit
MSPELIGALGFVILVALLLLRVPVGIAMLAVSTGGYASVISVDAALARLGSDAFSGAATYSLSVIPLFIYMGLLLAQAQLGKDLYALLDALLWRVRGGLAMATIGAAALFGSVNGSAVASASTMSVVATPEMVRYRYDPGLAAACTAVGGTLGALIPPSAVLVLYGILTEEPIGAVLIGGIVPGIATALALMVTAWLVVRRRRDLAPEIEQHRQGGSVLPLLGRVWAVPAIFGLTIGGLYFGVFTPTEAGGAGAGLALLYGVVTRRLTWRTFWQATSQTVLVSSVIFLIVVAGRMYGFFLSVTHIPRQLSAFVDDLDAAPFLVVATIFLIYLVLGALMDEIAILVIMTPVMYPIVTSIGYDGVWFGVVSIMMLLNGLLMPPVGIIVFVVSGITGINAGTIFRRLVPFWVAIVIVTGIAIAVPDLVMFLPNLMR